MKLSKLKLSIILFSTAVIISCNNKSGNTTTGNPFVGMAITNSSSAATVQYKSTHSVFAMIDLFFQKALAFPAPSSLLDLANNSVTLQYFWINIGEIEFKATETADSNEVDGSDVNFSGNYIVDLFSSSPQTIAQNTISVTSIQRIKMKLSKTTSLPTNAPSGLNGNSIYLQGQVGGYQFSFSTTEETEVQVAGPQTVTAESNKNLLLEFKAANLIKKIDLSSITSTTNINESNRVSASNPCPLIDSSANDLYTCFRKGFESEANLGRDDNGDYKLDNNEESVN